MTLKELYSQDINIQKYFRQQSGANRNDINSILHSYDYQAGSYTEQYFDNNVVKDPCILNGQKIDLTRKQYVELWGKFIAEELHMLHPQNVLEVGVGEATKLCDIILNSEQGIQFSGIELSLSRLLYAKKFAKYKKVDIKFAMGDMFSLPYFDNSFDVILMMHCLESNTGREEEALKELLRVAAKYVVLLEPSFELGNEATRKRIKDLCYIDNLQATIEKMNLNVIKYELFKITTFNNNAAITIIQKNPEGSKIPTDNNMLLNTAENNVYACPKCRSKLHCHKEAFFCPECFNLYPVIRDIPILNEAHAILCSKYEAEDII